LNFNVNLVHVSVIANLERKFTMVMSEDERQSLELMAASDGVSSANLVRRLIRREYAQRNDEPPHNHKKKSMSGRAKKLPRSNA